MEATHSWWPWILGFALVLILLLSLAVFICITAGSFLVKVGFVSLVVSGVIFVLKHLLTEAMFHTLGKGYQKFRNFLRKRKKPPKLS